MCSGALEHIMFSRCASGGTPVGAVPIRTPGTKFTMAVGIVVWIGFHQNRVAADHRRDCASNRREADWKPESAPLCMSSLSQ